MFIGKQGGWRNLAIASVALELVAYHPIDEIHKVDCPVLLIAGSSDRMTPPDVVKKGKVKLGRQAKYVEVPGRTHINLYEAPGLVEDIMLPFLHHVLVGGMKEFD